MSTYEPGIVAVATVRGVPNVRVFRLREGTWVSAQDVATTRVHRDEHVTDVRPLVTLDLSDPETVVKALRSVIEHGDAAMGGHVSIVWGMVQQIEAQTKPPKPDEPTGLGAVVEDAAGTKWVRIPDDTGSKSVWASWDVIHAYADIDAVRVLSEGVES